MHRKHRKQFSLIMKQSTEVILLTKWLKNTLAELAHEDDQYIVFKTHWIWLLSLRGFFTKRLSMRRFLAGTFICKLAEELAKPQVKKRNGCPGQAVPSQTRSSKHEAQPKKFFHVKIISGGSRKFWWGS